MAIKQEATVIGKMVCCSWFAKGGVTSYYTGKAPGSGGRGSRRKAQARVFPVVYWGGTGEAG